MKNLILFSASLFLNSIVGYSQTFDSLSIGNINARINSDGSIFYDKESMTSKMEWPKGSGKHTAFAGSIWLGAMQNNGSLHVSQQSYKQNSMDFYAGSFRKDENRVWKITKNEIENHKEQFDQLNFKPSQNILDWPGNSDYGQLAPYFDANGDNFYNPQNGDYPLISGDEAIFIVFNDQKAQNAMNIEVKALFYAYKSSDSTLSNTIFASYSLTNQNSFQIDYLKFGAWQDFDLGNWNDDFLGCDSLKNFFYVYNSSENDKVYGNSIPTMGVTFLNKKLTDFHSFNSDFNNSGVPTNDLQLFNHMNNGLSLTGIPEKNKGDLDKNLGYDRRGIGSTTITYLKENESTNIDLAYIISCDNNNLSSLAKLRNDVSYIQNIYDFNNLKSAVSKTEKSTLISDEKLHFTVCSSNSSQSISIKGLENDEKYRVVIMNSLGQSILESQISESQNTISLENQTNGMYLIQIQSQTGKSASNKFMLMGN